MHKLYAIELLPLLLLNQDVDASFQSNPYFDSSVVSRFALCNPIYNYDAEAGFINSI